MLVMVMRVVLLAAQAGLGLPNRDYYLGEQPAFVQVRAKYRDYIEQMLTLADVPDAKASATTVAALEKRIAARCTGRSRSSGIRT